MQAEILHSYEPDRDLLLSVESKMPGLNPSQFSKYVYANDALGRRQSVVRTGEAFGLSGSGIGDHNDLWTYNDRNELTASARFTGTGADTPGGGTADHALDRGYAYDPIGNRKTYDEGTSATLYYCANNLNQYTTTDDASTCPPGSGQERRRSGGASDQEDETGR